MRRDLKHSGLFGQRLRLFVAVLIFPLGLSVSGFFIIALFSRFKRALGLMSLHIALLSYLSFARGSNKKRQ